MSVSGGKSLPGLVWSHCVTIFRGKGTTIRGSIGTGKRTGHRQSSTSSSSLGIGNETYQTDSWTNIPPQILASLGRRLHLQTSHPIALTRKLIESRFASPTYIHYNELSPIVTVRQNFDSLNFPLDHPGRSRTDTYYVNQDTCLRTHSSAHQVDTFRNSLSAGFTISADVYRRDAIDRSHYPIFHQMEGARMWDRQGVSSSDVFQATKADVAALPPHNLKVEDPNPTVHPDRNPLQLGHSMQEVEAVASHLKRCLEDVVGALFSTALASRSTELSTAAKPEPIQLRWVEAYFPFTSPSWELEVFWQGDWLEVLGCGVVKQVILDNAMVPNKIGWAFGVGLERLAMVLYEIPDIRLFWSRDARFLSQFTEEQPITKFVPFSKYPSSPRDVAFWVRGTSTSAGGALQQHFHENDVMEIVRDIGGDMVEHVQLVDEFKHPQTGRKSYCYNINYRSLERPLSREEANTLHEKIRKELEEKLAVELR